MSLSATWSAMFERVSCFLLPCSAFLCLNASERKTIGLLSLLFPPEGVFGGSCFTAIEGLLYMCILGNLYWFLHS